VSFLCLQLFLVLERSVTLLQVNTPSQVRKILGQNSIKQPGLSRTTVTLRNLIYVLSALHIDTMSLTLVYMYTQPALMQLHLSPWSMVVKGLLQYFMRSLAEAVAVNILSARSTIRSTRLHSAVLIKGQLL
jgi:hypothetical protein